MSRDVARQVLEAEADAIRNLMENLGEDFDRVGRLDESPHLPRRVLAEQVQGERVHQAGLEVVVVGSRDLDLDQVAGLELADQIAERMQDVLPPRSVMRGEAHAPVGPELIDWTIGSALSFAAFPSDHDH